MESAPSYIMAIIGLSVFFVAIKLTIKVENREQYDKYIKPKLDENDEQHENIMKMLTEHQKYYSRFG